MNLYQSRHLLSIAFVFGGVHTAAAFPEMSNWNDQNAFLSGRWHTEVVLILGGVLCSLIWQQITV